MENCLDIPVEKHRILKHLKIEFEYLEKEENTINISNKYNRIDHELLYID